MSRPWAAPLVLTAALATLTSPSTATAGPPAAVTTNWASFGHDLSNTRQAAEWLLQRGNVGALRERWDAPGLAVTGTPAVADGFVYTSDFGGNLTARVAATGTLAWQTNLLPAQMPGSVAVVGGTVYAAGYGGYVFAVDRITGQPKWGTPIEPAPNALIWSSPVVVDNTLIIGSGSFQVFSPASPPFQGSVVGLDATTGALKWRTPVCTGSCTGVSVWSSAAVDPVLGLAYIGTGQSYTAPAGPMSDSLVAIDYRTGQVAWSRQYTPDDVFSDSAPYGKDADLGAAPNLFTVNGRRLVGCGDKGGSYRVFDARTGAPVWANQLVPGTQLGGIEETTAYADGVIYAVANTEETATSRADARPTKADLLAVDAATGRVRYRVALPAGGFGGVAGANGVLYFTTWDGILRAHAASTGATLFTRYIGLPDAPGVVEKGAAGGPSIANGFVFVGYGWTWGAIAAGGLRAFSVY